MRLIRSLTVLAAVAAMAVGCATGATLTPTPSVTPTFTPMTADPATPTVTPAASQASDRTTSASTPALSDDPLAWPTPTSTIAAQDDDITQPASATMSVAAWPDDDSWQTDAIVSAQGAMTAWADTSLDYAHWWAALKPWLSVNAAISYAWTDPAAIAAAGADIGAASVVSTSSTCTGPDQPCLVWVAIPADQGIWQVVVSHDMYVGWKAERFLQPGNPDQQG